MSEYETHITVRCPDAETLAHLEVWSARRKLKVTHIVLARGRMVSQPMLTLRDRTGHERLPEPVELACGAVVLAASPALSLAWKVLWLVSDAHPQGKDLYDAVLLAERYPLPYGLLDQVFRLAPEQPLPHPGVILEDITTYGDAGHEWQHFTAEYPQITGSQEDYARRLLAALEATFAEAPATPRRLLKILLRPADSPHIAGKCQSG
ncbi:hypothetical protein J7I97_17495 [Streptomyces sp. ISL-87]|uniref:hypothetical protein n=1 Tax=Streptomyces sp. ISL-87 TaxID=2819188 RepID=UPI001BE76B95|nr:hypothetical protein [Streptomyces sp. ISL-87]MBT2610019.1 hypothetical protein [Streptomyces sp. ISL-87]